MLRFRPYLRVFLIISALTSFMTYSSLSASAQSSCHFNSAGGKIQHVIYIQFDNTHLLRDNPNVPSDLEQMPHLLNFLKGQGTLSSNHHTVLISHTANGILTSLTGVYSDRHGIAVANNYPVFRPDGSTTFPSSFFYWTDLVSDVVSSSGDITFGMLAANGQNAPAPWVPFTRAGCDVGAYSTANIVIERTPFDVNKVFGAGSPESMDPNQFSNYAGTAVHCAQGSAICGNPKTKPVSDLLPQEPGSYTGYQALFGAKYINEAFQLKDIDGNPITGFAGFSPLASETLGAVASMQEAGIPVTIAYIADAHDNRAAGLAFGPGEAGYVAQLQAYDQAFAKFFARLAADGITKANTLFVFTADEGDHFAGGAPTPANCDGIHIPCSYAQIGEADLNLNGLVAAQTGNSTPFSIHTDMAPTVSITGNPPYTGSTARQLERDIASLTVTNPITGTTDSLTAALADPVEMGLLHMITADPARTPTFTMFGDPDYFFLSSGSTTPVLGPAFAWNHGGIQPEIARTWLGLVGPGVRQLGLDETFSDHADIRPTLIGLLGLHDDYQHDGRVLFEYLKPGALPLGSTANYFALLGLAQTYKQINAPFGPLGKQSLVVSTAALESNSTGDAVYSNLENKITAWHTRRDALAEQMKSMLEGAAFNNQAINQAKALKLIVQGQELLFEVNLCAQFLPFCEAN
ncbi:MAG TPA: hypothetical protein VMT53_23785 [Terriglobales bacterium]|nr:hypothetical protein [Terriglobales bacterium]